jgi:hypothetical protein
MSDAGSQRSQLKNRTLKSALKSRTWLLLALFASLVAAIPLLATPGLVSTRGLGGDTPFLLIRTYEMAQGLRAGHFPVRWMGQAAYGLGYPFFSFYSALPYYLAAALHLLGFGLLWSIRLTHLIGFLAAAAGMYALARRWLDSAPAAALAAVAYTFAPFHLVNVYVRGDSLTEFYAFVWYPLILLALHRLLERPSPGRTAVLALVYAALIVTHNISAMVFSPFVLLFVLLLLFDRSPQRGQKVKALGLTLAALVLGLLLSAWYWLPALREIDEVQMAEQTSGYFHYSNHFRDRDLVQSAATFDYDPDVESTPFAMGLPQAVLTLAGVVALLWRWLRGRRFDALGLLALLTLIGATLMITPLSRPLWDRLPLLPYTQFPWRFLSVQAFAGSLIVGVLAVVLSRPRLVAALAGIVLAAATLAGLRPEPLYITDADVTPERLALYEYFAANVGTTIRAEYLPRQAVPRPFASEAMLTIPTKPPPLVLEGTVSHRKLLEQRPQKERWQIDVISDSARVTFHTLYFPGWQAWADGHPLKIESWPGLGYISLTLKRGAHQVLLRFKDSPLRQKADLTMAGLAILFTLGLVARPWRGLRRHHFVTLGIVVVAIIVLPGLLRRLDPTFAPADGSDLTMDFSRQPYLHHNPAGVDFGLVRLSHYRLSADRVTAGEPVTLDLVWTDSRAEGMMAHVDLVFAVHEGLQHSVALTTSMATIPSGGGTTHHQVVVPADAVRGIYFLRLRIVGPDGALTAQTVRGRPLGHTYLQPLRVTAYRPAAGDELDLGRFGPHIALVEARAEPIGEDKLAVTLTWRCDGQVTINYGLSLRAAAEGAPLGQEDPMLPWGLYPTSMWQPGELVTYRHTLSLDADKGVDEVQMLEVILYDYVSPTLAPVGVAYIPLKERPRNFEIPTPEMPVGAEFGGQMRLLGYDLAQTDDALTLTLHWQAIQAMITDYKVFVHLFDPATENIVRQDDAMPLRNTYPTRWWAASEVVSDAISLSLTGVPAGQYRLAVGVYDPTVAPPNDRLAAVDGQGHPVPNHRLVLMPEITIP